MSFAAGKIPRWAKAPSGDRLAEVLAGIALAAWTYATLISPRTFADNLSYTQPVNAQLHLVLEAITYGCLIGAMLSRGERMGLLPALGGGALLAITYFSSLRTGKSFLPVLALFLVATRQMDLRYLARYALASTLAALVTILALPPLLGIEIGTASLGGDVVSTWGFDTPKYLAFSLYGVAVATALAFDPARRWVPQAIACATCSAATWLMVRWFWGAAFPLLVALCVVLCGPFARPLNEIASRRAVRVAVAALPIALCLASLLLVVFYSQDSPAMAVLNRLLGGRLRVLYDAYTACGRTFTLLGRTSSDLDVARANLDLAGRYWVDGAYGYYALVHGILPMAGFAVLYARSVLAGRFDVGAALALMLCLVGAAYLLLETFPSYLEFNCSLLLLSAGLCGGETSRSDRPMIRGRHLRQ